MWKKKGLITFGDSLFYWVCIESGKYYMKHINNCEVLCSNPRECVKPSFFLSQTSPS